ncbi:MAG TPA: ATP-binding protein [Planctomycetota bacterium]|nr:ATP-binding protein [Planctomycetota bacterium]
MIFEGKPIDEITDAEIDSLVSGHKAERQHLEFKVTVNCKEDKEKLELLHDIASLANGGGGYLIVGIRADGNGSAQKYEPTLVGNTEQIKQVIRDLCNDHILERIDGLEIVTRGVKGNPLVIVRIPESIRKPHMVTFKNSTDFYSRYNDVKREMTLGEIKEAFNQDIVLRRLSNVDAKLSNIQDIVSSGSSTIKIDSHNIAPVKKEEEQHKSVELGVSPMFLGIKSGSLLANETAKHFISEAKEDPYFRIAITPDSPKENTIDVESDNIQQLIINPPGSRRDGWNVQTEFPIERFSEGIRSGRKDYEYLEVFGNGHMEFWTPLNDHFCWRQSHEEFQKRPRLWPYPVIEYPTTFLRLYRALVDKISIGGNFLIDMQYRNIKGYVLPPHAPETIRFRFYTEDIKPFNGNHIVVPRATIPNDFKPDKIAYDLIKYVYASFELESKTIPFFNSEKEEFLIR